MGIVLRDTPSGRTSSSAATPGRPASTIAAGERYKSQFLEGTIRHRRHSPVTHEFTYPIGLYSIDLSEWAALDSLAAGFSTRRFSWVWLRRKDFFVPALGALDTAIRRHVKLATGWQPDGPVELVTHPRYLGYSFNPVSFYFCYETGATYQENPVPRVILAQITNTPWNEKHTYCLDAGPLHTGAGDWKTLRFRFNKAFHVSPFNPLDQHYDWLFSFRPGELRVHMNVLEQDAKLFDATLVVQRRPLDRTTMRQSIRRYPFETVKGVLGIYWNALKLKLKGAVFHGNSRTGADHLVQPDLPAVDSGKVTSWKL